jgi:hypothetical protein
MCHPDRPHVILSKAKDLGLASQILHYVQDDTMSKLGSPLLYSLSDL